MKEKDKDSLKIFLGIVFGVSLMSALVIYASGTEPIQKPPDIKIYEFELEEQPTKYEKVVEEVMPAESKVESKKEFIPSKAVTNLTTAVDEGQLQQLILRLEQEQYSFSYSYQNLDTGNRVDFKSSNSYNSGSIVKALYCKSIEDKVDMSAEIVIQNSDVSVHDEKKYEIGVKGAYTTKDLFEKALIDSSNTAYNALRRSYGVEDYIQLAKSFGIGRNLDKDGLCRMSARQATEFMIYLDSCTDSFTLDCLKRAPKVQLIDKGISSEYAHKYGSNGDGLGLHDTAIVYSNSAYVLSIFTNKQFNTKTKEMFEEVTRLTDNLNESIEWG